MSTSPAIELLAYTYIDLWVQISRYTTLIEDAQSIFTDLQKLDPAWYSKLEDPAAKKALKRAIEKVNQPQKHYKIDIPSELVL